MNVQQLGWLSVGFCICCHANQNYSVEKQTDNQHSGGVCMPQCLQEALALLCANSRITRPGLTRIKILPLLLSLSPPSVSVVTVMALFPSGHFGEKGHELCPSLDARSAKRCSCWCHVSPAERLHRINRKEKLIKL